MHLLNVTEVTWAQALCDPLRCVLQRKDQHEVARNLNVYTPSIACVRKLDLTEPRTSFIGAGQQTL